jgi:hypothetical protein
VARAKQWTPSNREGGVVVLSDSGEIAGLRLTRKLPLVVADNPKTFHRTGAFDHPDVADSARKPSQDDETVRAAGCKFSADDLAAIEALWANRESAVRGPRISIFIPVISVMSRFLSRGAERVACKAGGAGGGRALVQSLASSVRWTEGGELAERLSHAAEAVDQAILLAEQSLSIGRAIQDRFGQTINLELQARIWLEQQDVPGLVGAAAVLTALFRQIGPPQKLQMWGDLVSQRSQSLPEEIRAVLSSEPES